MPHYAAKRDINEKHIVDALRDEGAVVIRLSAPGLPDLLVGWRDTTFLLEVKSEKGTLTGPEQDFFEAWRGQCAIVRSVDDAKRAIGAID
jgi:hypothetical protein